VPVGVEVLNGSVWVSTTSGIVCEIDLTTGATIQSFDMGVGTMESVGSTGDDLLGIAWQGTVLNRYDTNGNFIGSTNIPSAQSSTGLDTSSSTIFIGDYGTGNVNTFDMAGNPLAVLPTGVGNSALSGLAYDPGSQGNLCLSGGIGRYNGNIMNTGNAGSFSLQLDLPNTPTPGGNVPVLAGQTWYFQCWFRDNNPGQTSNFTDGICITFN
jgi:hypothetical protein